MSNRITVPLSKEGYEAISLISQISGVPRGRILGETVELAIPSFIKIADAYRKAQQLEGERKASFIRGMKDAEAALLTVVEQLDMDFGYDPSSATARAPEARQRAGVGEGDPPLLTGGFPPPNGE